MTALLAGPAVAAPATDADTKAEFVARFGRFVAWPEGAAPLDGEPFVVGVVGAGQVASRLRRIAPNRQVDGHALRFVEIDRLEALEHCHLVVIAASGATDLQAVLEVTSKRPIVTIAVSPEVSAPGVLITFVTKNGGVGFSIDVDAVAHSGLRFSTKLLRLGESAGNGGE